MIVVFFCVVEICVCLGKQPLPQTEGQGGLCAAHNSGRRDCLDAGGVIEEVQLSSP